MSASQGGVPSRRRSDLYILPDTHPVGAGVLDGPPGQVSCAGVVYLAWMAMATPLQGRASVPRRFFYLWDIPRPGAGHFWPQSQK